MRLHTGVLKAMKEGFACYFSCFFFVKKWHMQTREANVSANFWSRSTRIPHNLDIYMRYVIPVHFCWKYWPSGRRRRRRRRWRFQRRWWLIYARPILPEAWQIKICELKFFCKCSNTLETSLEQGNTKLWIFGEPYLSRWPHRFAYKKQKLPLARKRRGLRPRKLEIFFFT